MMEMYRLSAEILYSPNRFEAILEMFKNLVRTIRNSVSNVMSVLNVLNLESKNGIWEFDQTG